MLTPPTDISDSLGDDALPFDSFSIVGRGASGSRWKVEKWSVIPWEVLSERGNGDWEARSVSGVSTRLDDLVLEVLVLRYCGIYISGYPQLMERYGWFSTYNSLHF